MNKDRPLRRLVDIIHERQEYEACIQGMEIGEFTPPLILKVDAWHACRIKAKAARRGGKNKRYYEGGYLSEFALDCHLKGINKRHDWPGLGSQVRPDFKLWQNKKPFTVDAHSARHITLMNHKHDPGITYPVRRLKNPEKRLDDYVFGASVISYTQGDEAGSSGVAYWGAIERVRLIDIMLKLWGNKPIPTANQNVRIPLVEFDPQLMMDLLEKADAGRRLR